MAKFDDLKRDGHTGEFRIECRFKNIRRRIWISNSDPDKSRETGFAMAQFMRQRQHKPDVGRRESRSLYWQFLDYIWQHHERTIPGGPRSMLRAISTQEALMALRWRRFLGLTPIGAVTAEQVLNYQHQRLLNGAKSQTARNEIGCLYRILRWAGCDSIADEIKGSMVLKPPPGPYKGQRKYVLKVEENVRPEPDKKRPLRYVPILCARGPRRPSAPKPENT